MIIVIASVYYGFLSSLSVGPAHLLYISELLFYERRLELRPDLSSILPRNHITIAAVSGMTISQLAALISIYSSSLAVLWLKPYVMYVVFMPYTCFCVYRHKYIINPKLFVSDDLKVRVRTLFFSSLLWQALNPRLLLSNCVMSRVMALYVFRYSATTVFVLGGIVGWLSGQALFLLCTHCLLLQFRRNKSTVPLFIHGVAHHFIIISLIAFALQTVNQNRVFPHFEETVRNTKEPSYWYQLHPYAPLGTLVDLGILSRAYRFNSLHKPRAFQFRARQRVSEYFFQACVSDGKRRLLHTAPHSVFLFRDEVEASLRMPHITQVSSKRAYHNWLDPKVQNEQSQVQLWSDPFLHNIFPFLESRVFHHENENLITLWILTKPHAIATLFSSPLHSIYALSAASYHVLSTTMQARINSIVSNTHPSRLDWSVLLKGNRYGAKTHRWPAMQPIQKAVSSSRVSAMQDALLPSLNEQITKLIDLYRQVPSLRDTVPHDLRITEATLNKHGEDLVEKHEKDSIEVLETKTRLSSKYHRLPKNKLLKQLSLYVSTSYNKLQLFFDDEEKMDKNREAKTLFFRGICELPRVKVRPGRKKRQRQHDKEDKRLNTLNRKIGGPIANEVTHAPLLERFTSGQHEGPGERAFTRRERIVNRIDRADIFWLHIIRAPRLLLSAATRKFIIMPALIVLKSVLRALLFHPFELWEDWKDWSRETYVFFDYREQKSSKTNLPEEWYIKGLHIKVLNYFDLKPWRSLTNDTRNKGSKTRKRLTRLVLPIDEMLWKDVTKGDETYHDYNHDHQYSDSRLPYVSFDCLVTEDPFSRTSLSAGLVKPTFKALLLFGSWQLKTQQTRVRRGLQPFQIRLAECFASIRSYLLSIWSYLCLVFVDLGHFLQRQGLVKRSVQYEDKDQLPALQGDANDSRDTAQVLPNLKAVFVTSVDMNCRKNHVKFNTVNIPTQRLQANSQAIDSIRPDVQAMSIELDHRISELQARLAQQDDKKKRFLYACQKQDQMNYEGRWSVYSLFKPSSFSTKSRYHSSEKERSLFKRLSLLAGYKRLQIQSTLIRVELILANRKIDAGQLIFRASWASRQWAHMLIQRLTTMHRILLNEWQFTYDVVRNSLSLSQTSVTASTSQQWNGAERLSTAYILHKMCQDKISDPFTMDRENDPKLPNFTVWKEWIKTLPRYNPPYTLWRSIKPLLYRRYWNETTTLPFQSNDHLLSEYRAVPASNAIDPLFQAVLEKACKLTKRRRAQLLCNDYMGLHPNRSLALAQQRAREQMIRKRHEAPSHGCGWDLPEIRVRGWHLQGQEMPPRSYEIDRTISHVWYLKCPKRRNDRMSMLEEPVRDGFRHPINMILNSSHASAELWDPPATGFWQFYDGNLRFKVSMHLIRNQIKRVATYYQNAPLMKSLDYIAAAGAPALGASRSRYERDAPSMPLPDIITKQNTVLDKSSQDPWGEPLSFVDAQKQFYLIPQEGEEEGEEEEEEEEQEIKDNSERNFLQEVKPNVDCGLERTNQYGYRLKWKKPDDRPGSQATHAKLMDDELLTYSAIAPFHEHTLYNEIKDRGDCGLNWFRNWWSLRPNKRDPFSFSPYFKTKWIYWALSNLFDHIFEPIRDKDETVGKVPFEDGTMEPIPYKDGRLGEVTLEDAGLGQIPREPLTGLRKRNILRHFYSSDCANEFGRPWWHWYWPEPTLVGFVGYSSRRRNPYPVGSDEYLDHDIIVETDNMICRFLTFKLIEKNNRIRLLLLNVPKIPWSELKNQKKQMIGLAKTMASYEKRLRSLNVSTSPAYNKVKLAIYSIIKEIYDNNKGFIDVNTESRKWGLLLREDFISRLRPVPVTTPTTYPEERLRRCLLDFDYDGQIQPSFSRQLEKPLEQAEGSDGIKRFLWPIHRLEDLSCMNRFWFGSSNQSRFSMLRIKMYPSTPR